jgi:hypothetical protein
MPHRLGLLEPLAVPVARPHPDLLATVEPVVPHPHDGLIAVVGGLYAGFVDHAPASPGLGDHGVGVVIHLPALAAQTERPQDPAQAAVGAPVSRASNLSLGEGARTLCGRRQISEVTSRPVELAAEGLTTWHESTLDPPEVQNPGPLWPPWPPPPPNGPLFLNGPPPPKGPRPPPPLRRQKINLTPTNATGIKMSSQGPVECVANKSASTTLTT